MVFDQNLSFGIAFVSGWASFFSPCLLPMIPAYICYMAGESLEDAESVSRGRAVLRTLFFILGFTIVFLLLGLSASGLGRIFITHKQLLQKIAGLMIMLFGLQFMGILKLGFMMKPFSLRLGSNSAGSLKSFLMGLGFGAGWTPCFGPVLASILMMAAAGQSEQQGMMLLLVYAVGLGLPFLVTAIFIKEIMPLVLKTGTKGVWIERVLGLVLILFGFLMMMNWLVKVNLLFAGG